MGDDELMAVWEWQFAGMLEGWRREQEIRRERNEIRAFGAVRHAVSHGVAAPSWALEALDPESILARDAMRVAGELVRDPWAGVG